MTGQQREPDIGIERVTTVSGALGRFGLGIDLRSRGFAFHPEVNWVRAFEDDVSIITFGIGFNFVNLPDYSGAGF